MTIAGLHLGPRQSPEIATFSLAEYARARRSRRLSLAAYFLLWTAFFVYAVSRAVGAGDIAAALDRFLPLQFVAALLAVAVYLCGRSLRRGGLPRRISMVPALVTVTGAFLTLVAVGAVGPDQGGPAAYPADVLTYEPIPGPMVVSL